MVTFTADAAFQLDFFGRLRPASEAASDYFTLLQLDLQLQIMQETVKAQSDSVKATRNSPSLAAFKVVLVGAAQNTA